MLRLTHSKGRGELPGCPWMGVVRGCALQSAPLPSPSRGCGVGGSDEARQRGYESQEDRQQETNRQEASPKDMRRWDWERPCSEDEQKKERKKCVCVCARVLVVAVASSCGCKSPLRSICFCLLPTYRFIVSLIWLVARFAATLLQLVCN